MIFLLQIPEPTQRISPKASTVWRISSAIFTGGFLIILGILIFLSFYFDWFEWIKITLYIITAITTLNLIYRLTIYPVYMQHTWRYEIDEDFVQIKYGFINRYHAIIPMSRVEYVNTDQGPLLRKFGLASLTIGTLTSPHEIPALSNDEAAEIRSKIVYLAKIVDVVEEEPVEDLTTKTVDARLEDDE